MHTLLATTGRLVRRARTMLRSVRPWPLRLLVAVLALALAIAVAVKLWLPIVVLLGTTIVASAFAGRANLAGTLLAAVIGAVLAGLVLSGLPAIAVAAGVVIGIWEQRQVAFVRPGGGQPLAGQPVKAPIWARIGRGTK